MMEQLNRGERPTDDGDGKAGTTTIKSDHFLIIDNDGAVPRVLLNFANEDDKNGTENFGSEVKKAAEEIFKFIKPIRPWYSLCQYLYRIVGFFLKDDPVFIEGVKEFDAETQDISNLTIPEEPEDLMEIITEVDEETFEAMNPDATTDETDFLRQKIGKNDDEVVHMTPRGEARLNSLTPEAKSNLKNHISLLRKFGCVAVMREIRDSDSDSSDSDSSTDEEK